MRRAQSGAAECSDVGKLAGEIRGARCEMLVVLGLMRSGWGIEGVKSGSHAA